MKDDHKTKKQLVQELTELRSQNAALKESITGSLSAELAFKEVSRYAESIVETVREPLLVLDADLKIISANRNFYRTFKAAPGETIGSYIYDLGNKQWDIPKLRELLEEVLPEKEAFDDFEVEHNFQDIGHKIMLLNARQIYRKDTGTKRILLAIEDITEHKRLENLLIESEQQYRRLFETASDGIVLLEKREGKIAQANPATEKLLGYTEKESIGNKLKDIGVVLDTNDFQTTMQNLNKSGILNYRNVKVETKSGQHIDTEIYLVDRAKLVQCNIRDITGHKRVQEALRQSEEKYRWLVDNMADVITVMNMNLQFTYVSPSIVRMRGYTAEEATAQTFEQVMTPESLQIITKVFEEEMQLEASGRADPRRSRILELEQYRKDGSIVLMENHLSFLRDEAQKAVGIISLSRNITERKRDEAKLRHQADAMDAATDGIAILNADGQYVYLNKAHAKIYGYENSGELIGKPWRILYDSDVLQRFDQEIMPEFSRKGNWHGEATGRKKDGGKFPQELSLTAMADGGLICVVRDITERKQAEERLREKEQLLSESQRLGHIGSWLSDIKGQLFWSEEMYHLYGVSPDTFTPTMESLLSLIHPDDQALMQAWVEACASGKKPGELEFRIKRHDGTIRFIKGNGEAVSDVENRLIYMAGTAQDITDRKRAEEALKKSENKYRMLADNVNDVIFVLDMNLNYTYVSPSVKILRGYDPEEVLKQQPSEVLAPFSLDLVMMTLSEIMELEKSKLSDIPISKTLELEMIRKDGSTVWTEVKFSFIRDQNQRPVGILGLTRDITERKQAEEQLQQTLDRLRKAVGTTIQVMVSAVEARDPYTAGHQIRSANLARCIATEMGLSQEKIEGIRMAGSIHDIGKLSIPAEILSKPTKLTNIEFSLIKEHAKQGYEMLKHVESPWPLAEIVFQHHERIDGSGYPRNLKGDDILMEARVLAVSDVVESMASHRPYRPAIGVGAALEEIEKNKGILYEDTVVDACLRLFREKGFQLERT